jgi:hypothetical protein
VTNVSQHGLWLLTSAGELFLSYDDFPWFKDKTISQICHVEEPAPQHYYWPDLDIDLGLETIKEPQRFPLKAQQ